MQNEFGRLRAKLDGELHTDRLRRLMYATDASDYKELPEAIAYPRHEADIRELVHFASRAGTVAVQPEHLGHGGNVPRNLSGVPREGRSGLDDAAHVRDVMVASTLESGTRGRADRRGVEVVVVQPGVGKAVEGRGVDGTAECAGSREPEVVDQNDQDIRGPLGGGHLEARRGLGMALP